MKSIKNKIYSLLILMILLSCKNESTTEVSEIKTKKNYNQLEKANWFIGNWENISKEMQMKELWMRENDSCFSAKSFVIVKKDTVFYENVDLVQRNDSLFYIVSVKDQNKEKPVSFYMTIATENELVFENPKHDFPNKITYSKITNDSLVATIFGLKDGKVSSETFPMKKNKTN